MKIIKAQLILAQWLTICVIGNILSITILECIDFGIFSRDIGNNILIFLLFQFGCVLIVLPAFLIHNFKSRKIEIKELISDSYLLFILYFLILFIFSTIVFGAILGPFSLFIPIIIYPCLLFSSLLINLIISYLLHKNKLDIT